MNSAEQIVTPDLLRIVSVPFGEIYTEYTFTEPTLYRMTRKGG